MDIFTAIIGKDLDAIKEAESFTSKDEAEKFIKDNREDNDAGIVNGKTNVKSTQSSNDKASLSNKSNWSVVNNAHIEGILCKNKEDDDLWIIIKVKDTDIEINLINLNDERCNDCDSSVVPFTKKIRKCTECSNLFYNDRKIQEEEIEEIKEASNSINIEINENGESKIDESVKFDNGGKLPSIADNQDINIR